MGFILNHSKGNLTWNGTVKPNQKKIISDYSWWRSLQTSNIFSALGVNGVGAMLLIKCNIILIKNSEPVLLLWSSFIRTLCATPPHTRSPLLLPQPPNKVQHIMKLFDLSRINMPPVRGLLHMPHHNGHRLVPIILLKMWQMQPSAT